MTLHEIRLKCKEFWEPLESREAYTVLLIIFVGFASFGMGRLSTLQEARVPIRIEQTLSPQTASALASSPSFQFQEGDKRGSSKPLPSSSPFKGGEEGTTPGGQLVASKNGGKYHFPWCSGAQRISEANKVWFDSVEEARKAGYTPASNCKGLK